MSPMWLGNRLQAVARSAGRRTNATEQRAGKESAKRTRCTGPKGTERQEQRSISVRRWRPARHVRQQLPKHGAPTFPTRRRGNCFNRQPVGMLGRHTAFDSSALRLIKYDRRESAYVVQPVAATVVDYRRFEFWGSYV